MVPLRIVPIQGRQVLGQDLNAGTKTGRTNLSELATGAAFVGGSALALTQLAKYRKEPMSQVAMGVLSAGLMIRGLLSIWDGLES